MVMPIPDLLRSLDKFHIFFSRSNSFHGASANSDFRTPKVTSNAQARAKAVAVVTCRMKEFSELFNG